MSENDYIAEYVKEKHAYLLKTVDFACWRAGRIIAEMITGAVEIFKTIDFKDISTEQLLGEEHGFNNGNFGTQHNDA